MKSKLQLLWLSVFAIAMAYLEAAVVVYLRELYYPENILRLFPMTLFTTRDLAVELGREAATVVMMLSVALLVERKNGLRRFAAFCYLFGMWDLFYYIWLKVTIGWPVAWLEWDILFLIPWIWLGPWICPALISLLFILWGGWIVGSAREYTFPASGKWLFLSGAVLALISFLQPAVPILLTEGREGLLRFAPGGFWWWLFLPGYVLMAAGLGRVLGFPGALARKEKPTPQPHTQTH